MTETYEHYFVTQDLDSDGNPVVFGVIEDESGDIFWGYGHQAADAFRAEVNRWLTHVGCGENCVDEGYWVDHIYAYNHDGERFMLATPTHPAPPGVETFPVTRLML